MKAITYRGYSAEVEYDAEDRIFTGRLTGIEDIVGFHADTIDELQSAFRQTIDDYIQTVDV